MHYARSGQCRWRLLLEHFDETPMLTRCGHCDNCALIAAVEGSEGTGFAG